MAAASANPKPGWSCRRYVETGSCTESDTPEDLHGPAGDGDSVTRLGGGRVRQRAERERGVQDLHPLLAVALRRDRELQVQLARVEQEQERLVRSEEHTSELQSLRHL